MGLVGWNYMPKMWLLGLMILSGCDVAGFIQCGDRGVRTCDGFLCLHNVCSGEPLTNAEIKAGVKERW